MDARAIIDALKRETGINTDKSLAEEMGIKYPTFANWITRNSLQYDVIIPFCESKGVDMNQIFGKRSTIQNINGGIRGGQNAQNVEGNQSLSTLPTRYEIDEALLKLIQNAVVMVDADEEKINQLKALIKKWTMEQI